MLAVCCPVSVAALQLADLLSEEFNQLAVSEVHSLILMLTGNIQRA
jgi:hypothetical protein